MYVYLQIKRRWLNLLCPSEPAAFISMLSGMREFSFDRGYPLSLTFLPVFKSIGDLEISSLFPSSFFSSLAYAYMCCNLAGSVGCREHWLRDTARKRKAFFFYFFYFLLFWESFNCCNFGTTGLIQVGFAAKCTSPNEDFNRKLKCHMFEFDWFSDWFP